MRSCPQCSRIQADSLAFCPQDGAALGEVDPLLGQTISGQFVLQQRIGQGGSGDVYRAYQLGVDRQVAVKVLQGAAAREPEFAARFAREARAAARLSHPNIVTVYQLGESEHGLPYIAMEWADACPIGHGHKLLSQREILVAATQIASALSEAHEAGIIHRDLKPANVLVGTRGGAIHVTLVDFGIAKIVNAQLMQRGETNLTRTGVVYGTPQYLSPEQAGGQPVDARADLYSFGVMLYELFSGRLPFEAQGMSLLVDHLTTKPKHIARLVPGIDTRVATLIMSMLEKSPSRRPASAARVLAELERILRYPIEPRIALEGTPQRRNPSGTGLGLMVATLLWLASSDSLGKVMPEVDPGIVMASASVVLSPPGKVAVKGQRQPVVREQESTSVPQRALMVSSARYSMRVLVPEYLGAMAEHAVAVELWDRGGEPIGAESLIFVFTDVSGLQEGVSVSSGPVPGRYEIKRSFDGEGTWAMQVLPERGGVALRVHFDVEAEGLPNS